jgi:N-acetylmuramoyl-L-alanine amidase
MGKWDLLIIDAGHGGKDPGCIYQDLKEKDITLRLAKILYILLDGNCYLLRDKDYYLTLEQRTFAINKFCELNRKPFVLSLHVNDADNKEARGAEIIYCKLNPYHKYIIDLSKDLLEIYTTQLKLKNRGVKECLNCRNFHLYLLKNTQCPSIIFELGFIKTDFSLKSIFLKDKLSEIGFILSNFIKNYIIT